MIASVIMLFFKFIFPQVVTALLSVEIMVIAGTHKVDTGYYIESKITSRRT